MWQKALFDAGLVATTSRSRCCAIRHDPAFTYYDSENRLVPYAEVVERDGKFFRKGTDAPLVRRSEKMSKRKGNVVNPDEVVREYGADAMRVYLCFLGPLKDDKPWSPEGIEAQWSWLKRVWRVVIDDADQPRADASEPSNAELRVIHKAIKKVTEDIDRLHLHGDPALHVATAI
jgi:leucyl-tRNA synthetase